MATQPSAPAPETARSRRVPMWRRRSTWAIVGGIVLARVAMVRAFRAQNPAVIGAVKAFNRRWLNPWMLRHAGRRHWYAGRLDVRGRRTGLPRSTPLMASRIEGGFLVPMPYGRDVDWAANLLVAGEGVLHDDGERYRVVHPRIVPTADVLADLPGLVRYVAWLYGIRAFMRVDALPDPPPTR